MMRDLALDFEVMVRPWDRLGLASRYIDELSIQAGNGGFDRERLPAILQSLIRDVLSGYSGYERDAALTGLASALVDINREAEKARGAGRHNALYAACLAEGLEKASSRQTGSEAPPAASSLWNSPPPPQLTVDQQPRQRVMRPSVDGWKIPPRVEVNHVNTAEGQQSAFDRLRAADLPKFDPQYGGTAEKPTPAPGLSPIEQPAIRRHPQAGSKPSKPEAEAAPAQQAASSGRRTLNARGLHKSIIPTWLGLVGISWLSLIWGTMISIPFGVGLVLIGSFMAGLVAVPLWGTIFGFGGMMSARSGTLRSMGFVELPANHPLQAKCAEYAHLLDIPKPQLGTVPVFNAFAMGLSRRDATVAMGEPLLKTLTPDQIDAVLAHELGHVVSGDMRRMMLMRTFQNATVWYMMFQGAKQFVRWIVCWIAELWILWFSRHREYWADAVGAELAGKDAMIGALRALENAPALSSDERKHARFMFRGRFNGVLNTHPSFGQRVYALDAETYLKRLPRR